MKVFLLLAVLTISGCSLVTDALKSAVTDDGGIHADAQVGSNENKVKTGVGSIGGRKETDQTIKGNDGTVEVRNTDGKFHIESQEDITVVVEETNDMVYYLMGFFFLLTMLREFFSWRKNRDT